MLFARIELEDHVPLLHGLASANQAGKLQCRPAHRRSGEHDGMAGPELAAGVNAQIDIAALYLGEWNIAGRRSSRHAARRNHRANAAREQHANA